MIRKITSIIFFALLLISTSTFAQNADAILGKWINPSGEGQIQIYKKGNIYFGKLSWLKQPNDEASGKPKTDINNPDAQLRQRPLIGLELLKNFKFDDETYEDGSIYDPKNGKTYKCKMTLNGDKLKIRGYIGVSLLGRTEVWSRVK